MSEAYVFRCSAKDCSRIVRGIYCDEHREARARIEAAAGVERSERMKALWAADPEGMKAKLLAGRAPAEEGA